MYKSRYLSYSRDLSESIIHFNLTSNVSHSYLTNLL